MGRFNVGSACEEFEDNDGGNVTGSSVLARPVCLR